MAQIETWFSQDLQQAVKVHYIDGNVFSADNNGNIIGVNVFYDGEPATLGGTVSASIIRADGATVAATGTLSGNQVSVSLPQSAYAVPGVISIVLKLTSGTDVTTLLAVVGNVYQSTTDTVVDPGTIIPSVETLIAEIEAAVASIPADYSSLWTSLAPAYSTSSVYSVGRYVTYNGGLYRCISAITSGESWTAAHWTAVSLGNDVSDLKTALYPIMWGNIKQFHFPNLLRGTPKTGYYVPYNTGVEDALETWEYFIVPSPGNYYCMGMGGSHIAFFDKTGTYISGALIRWQDGYLFQVPANCAYFTFSCAISNHANAFLVIASEHTREKDSSEVFHFAPEAQITIANAHDLIKPKKNLFNKNVTISGGFIDYSGKGSFDSNENFSYCPWFIPAKPSTKYKPNTYCIVGEFDKDYNWLKCDNITTAAALNNTPFTTHENCAYVRISCYTSTINTFMLEEGENTTAYSPFQMEFIGDDESEAPGRTIIVDANGGGNYTTISAACAAANDGDTIYVCDGVYYESVKINGLRVHLVGESRDGTVLKYLGTQYANPPLEMSNGSIENMTIWAITESGASGGGGYCLHCDNEASANGYLYCRNVKFQNDYYQVIGIGLQPHFTLSFEDCEFIGQVYVHDSAKTFDDLTGQFIRFVNCSIKANTYPFGAIRMQTQERTGAEATILFQRCIVKNTATGGEVVTMTAFNGETLSGSGWLNSSDWSLDGLSALNNANILDAE